VKLVAEKLAIYDISWSNDGLDEAGIIKLRECKVEAYVWNSNDATFDFNRKLSREATRSYCRQLQHEAH
jgi:hypothetical protein